MRATLIYLIYFLTICQVARAQTSKDYFDVGHYKHTINFDGHHATFYLQSAAIQLKSPQTDKLYWWYANNQISRTQGGYSGKLLHGQYSDFYENKNLREQGLFKLGLKDKVWKTWSDTGIMTQMITYKEGIPEGAFTNYDNKGRLLESGSYKQGKLEGKFLKYGSPDSIQIFHYRNGLLKEKEDGILKRSLKLFNKKKK